MSEGGGKPFIALDFVWASSLRSGAHDELEGITPADFWDVICYSTYVIISWLARLDHSHCNSADPLTDGLEVCCLLHFKG